MPAYASPQDFVYNELRTALVSIGGVIDDATDIALLELADRVVRHPDADVIEALAEAEREFARAHGPLDRTAGVVAAAPHDG